MRFFPPENMVEFSKVNSTFQGPMEVEYLGLEAGYNMRMGRSTLWLCSASNCPFYARTSDLRDSTRTIAGS